MGAVSPVPYVDAVMDKIETRIVKPTIEGLQRRNPQGFVFIGLINVTSPLLLNITSEWEIRKQVVVPRLKI
jgi:phosphoribosylamine--glycine ligase